MPEIKPHYRNCKECAKIKVRYNFLYVNIGCQGRISDGEVFNNCELNEKLKKYALNIPQPTALPTRTEEIPFYFVGDEAFALSENMMKVYAGYHERGSKERIYNYRICRARRVVENVFGILSAVFSFAETYVVRTENRDICGNSNKMPSQFFKKR